MKKRPTLLPFTGAEATALFAVAAVALTGGWAADHLLAGAVTLTHGPQEGGPSAGWLFASGGLGSALLLLSLAWTYSLRRVLLSPRTRRLRQGDGPPPKRCLILFLSSLPDGDRFDADTGVPRGVPLTGDLDRDLDEVLPEAKSDVRWSWEMPLRALRHHRPELREVVVIGSGASLPQAGRFARMLRHHYPALLAGVRLRLAVRGGGKALLIDVPPADDALTAGSGWDFEEFDQLRQPVTAALDELTGPGGHTEGDIVIDVTGGQKPTSVVGASATFNREVITQYVQTGGGHKIIYYDLILTPIEESEV